MNEITGPNGASNLQGIAQPARAKYRSTRGDAARELTRASDDASLSVEGRALSQLSELPEVRTEEVNRVQAAINDPSYDINAKFEHALEKMFNDIFQS